MDTMKIKAQGSKRTILMQDGQPVLVGLAMRESTTAHGRFKCALYVPAADADEMPMPLPFADAVMLDHECPLPPHGFTPEFRIEMN